MMKALSEVIDSITKQSGLEIRDMHKPEKDRFWVDRETYNDALCYLRMYKELADDSEAYAEWRENPPLTWDELKGMEGKPVWVEYNLHLSDKDARSRMWIIIQQIFRWKKDDELIYYSGFVFGKKEMGKTWNAYRKERE